MGQNVLNYTTKIPVDRTTGEVQRMLAQRGCSAVAMHYTEDGRADGLSFTLRTPHGERAFHMPVNLDGVLLLLQTPAVRSRASKDRKKYDTPEHAEAVAWRIVRDWLEAQLALVDANMASLDQVMLPHLRVDPEHTLYEAYKAREDALTLTAGASS